MTAPHGNRSRQLPLAQRYTQLPDIPPEQADKATRAVLWRVENEGMDPAAARTVLAALGLIDDGGEGS